jgi:hypothetical protein
LEQASGSWQIYFLSLVDPADLDRDLELVKVGITQNDVETRIEQLQTGNPYQIRCEASFRSTVARQVERWIHRTNASAMAHLEWLRLPRSEIQALANAAKQESERLARIDQAMEYWSGTESNGEEREPTVEEQRLHKVARDVLANLWPIKLRLRHVEASMALQAGKVLRIPGILKTVAFTPSRRFRSRIVIEKFPDLAAKYSVEKVKGRFRWRDVPSLGSPEWAGLRADVEHLEVKTRELDAAMLADSSWSAIEGARTGNLARLHDEYLLLRQQEARLRVDEEEMQAQAVQALADCQAIARICSFRRSLSPVLDRRAFCEAQPTEAAQCCSERGAYVRRRIYLSRSY